MDPGEFERKVLGEKIERFKSEVKKAAKKLKIKEPIVKIWECPHTYRSDEVAHCHHESKEICISEYKLRNLSFEDITNTATHEVSHLLHNNHSQWFHETHQSLKASTWTPPTGYGLTVISSNDPVVVRKNHKVEIDKTKCGQCSLKNKRLERCAFCERYFCENHIKPTEAKLKKFTVDYVEKDDENTHPCLGYNKYLDKKEEREKERYGEALDKILNRRSKYAYEKEENETETHSNIPNSIDFEEPVVKLSPKKHKPTTPHKKHIIPWSPIFTTLLITFLIVLFINFDAISNGFNSLKDNINEFRLKSSYKENFNDLNKIRISNNLANLTWSEKAYSLSIYLAKEKEDNRKQYINNSDKLKIVLDHNLSSNTNFFYGGLDQLNKTQVADMMKRMSNYDLPKVAIVNKSYDSGALGCYLKSCVLVITKS